MTHLRDPPLLRIYIIISEILQNSFLIISSLLESSSSLDVGFAVMPTFPRPLFQALMSEQLALLGSCVGEGFSESKGSSRDDARLQDFIVSPRLPLRPSSFNFLA